VVDIDRTGRLSKATIAYFYRDVYASLLRSGYDAPAVDDVVEEVFDIVACNDEEGPTFDM
jgi:hypothetical protein